MQLIQEETPILRDPELSALEPVYNEEMVLVVVVGDVTGVEPLVRTDGLRGGLRVVEVPFHHLLSSKLFPSHLLSRERHKPVEYQFAYLK